MTNWLGTIGIFAGAVAAVAVITERACEVVSSRRRAPAGRLVPISEGRELHLVGAGDRGLTVIVEQGAGEPAVLWQGLQEQAAAFCRICLYDRAGYGWSPRAPAPQSVAERAADLRSLLRAAGEEGPYVLVAHSYGGLIVRAFARDFPDDVAGLLMIDAIEESIAFHPEYLAFLRFSKPFVHILRVAAALGLMRLIGGIGGRGDAIAAVTEKSRRVAAEQACRPSHFRAVLDDLRSIEQASRDYPLPAAMGGLGDIPVVAITHGKPFPGPFARLEPFWRDGQQRLVSLTSKGELIVADQSNHMVAFEQPEIVLDALRGMIAKIDMRKPGPISAA